MNMLLLAAVLLLPTDDVPKKPLSARPAALVLKVEGAVVAEGRLGKRSVEPGDLLLPGEILSTPADTEAVLVFLVHGERRRLPPQSRITLTRDGCEPADAVEKGGTTKLSRKNLTKVPEVEVCEGGGVGVVRGTKPTTEARVTPLFGAFVMTDRPTFTWPPVEKAKGYVFELKEDGGGPTWKAATQQTRLDFPSNEKPLKHGQKYLWNVQAQLPEDEVKPVVTESNFKLLLQGEPEELVGVQRLAESKDIEDLLLAAAAFEGYAVYDEALKIFEKLARLQPKAARYQLALARYYRHAGRADKAREALEQVKKLGAALKD